MLDALGIDPGAEKVYRYLLQDPRCELQDIRAALGWSEQEVREALDHLAGLRLIVRGSDGVCGLPAHPESALSFLLASAESELHRRQRDLDLARLDIFSLAEEPGEGSREIPGQGFDVVARLTAAAAEARLAELAASARSEWLSIDAGGTRWTDVLRSEPPGRAARGGRFTLRAVLQESARADAGTLRHVRWLTELGGQARTVPVAPVSMVLVDRRAGLVPLDPDDGGAGALEVRSPGLIAVQRLLFESYWHQGAPVGRESPSDLSGLNLRDREVLRLLASGCTDGQVARRLGVSLRTVRRINAQLTARLGARSRFEAGALSAQRGWI